MATRAADVVGREDELAAIAGFLEAEARPCAVVVEGDAGIGKTTVWRTAVEQAAGQGFRVLRARPAESEARLAFSSLADLIEEPVPEVIEALPEPQRRALQGALLLDDAGGRVDRRAVGAALLNTLRALAARSPVMIAVDDLQWLDRSSSTALGFALRRLQQEPVALLLSRRAEACDLEQALPPERILRVAVGPLGFQALNAVLRERVDETLSRPLLRRIHELSGGNPFFALELAQSPNRVAAGTLPPTLDALVRERLATLPEETQLALLVAAAASHPTQALVVGVVGAADALAPAEAAGIVELDHGEVCFAHPLLASGAYTASDPARRREVHRQLAEAARDPEERARHLAAAASGPDEKVAAALERAAARARARGAPAAAAELSEDASRLTPADREEARLRRLADAGYFHFAAGDGRRASEQLEEAVSGLDAGPDRAKALTRLARVRSHSVDLEAATGLFLQAVGEAGDDRELRARALEGAAAQLFRRRTQLDQAVEHAKAAAGLARELDDDGLLALALGSQLLAEATLGRPEAAATLEAALVLQPKVEARRVLAQPAWSAAVARMWWEDPGGVEPAFDQLMERGRAAGDEGSLAYAYVMLAQAECLLGRFERARRDAVAAGEIGEQAGQHALVAYGLAFHALADACQGREDEAREAAGAALEVGQATQFTPVTQVAGAALGLLELSLGRPDEAADRLAPLVEFARAEGLQEPGLTRYVPDQVEALADLGRLEEAAELLEWFEGNAERLCRRGAIASSLRCRGLLAAANGHLDEALGAFEQALVEHDAVSLPLDRARTLLLYGAALRRAKRKADARDRLGEASAALAELGADAFVARAQAELARIGGRRRSEGGLTATERQIAELVAEGRSNKEVAAALFVTVKTVEANLSRVYAKLGLRSRAELARHMAAKP